MRHVSHAPYIADLFFQVETRLASVQDACILAMLRLAADCEVSSDVSDTIARIYDKAGRHIRKVGSTKFPRSMTKIQDTKFSAVSCSSPYFKRKVSCWKLSESPKVHP